VERVFLFVCRIPVLLPSHDLKPTPSNDLHESSVLEIEVYRHHKIGRDDHIGGVKESIEVLLAEGATGQSISPIDGIQA
jgi:hypothetical protein